jgi:hypothetical protein
LARRQPELVEPADVAGIGDRDLDRRAVRGERNRTDALEHGQRDQLRSFGVDAGDRKVDQRQVVLLGERPRHAEGAREALVDESLRERAADSALARLLDLVRLEQPRLADDLRDEIALTTCFVTCRRRLIAPLSGRVADEPEVWVVVGVHSDGLH